MKKEKCQKLMPLFATTIVITFVVLLNKIDVVANPRTMPDGGLFDVNYYISHNQDVAYALGVYEDVLYNHYKLFGKAEGRLPYDPSYNISLSVINTKTNATLPLPNEDIFDPAYYAKAYPDVVAALGNDSNTLYQHYVLFGINEGRMPHGALAGEAVSKSGVSESQAYQKLQSLKACFPEGMRWDYTIPDYEFKGYGGKFSGTECCGYALMMSDLVFGYNNDAHSVSDRTQAVFRSGDILHYYPKGRMSGHYVVILQTNDKGVVVTEGNYNGKVHWGRTITWAELDKGFDYIITRY